MFYQLIECDTARSFLEALNINDPIWVTDSTGLINNPMESEKWIFRGHGNGNYKLIPSAWRSKKIFSNLSKNKIFPKIIDLSSPWTGNFGDLFKQNRLNYKRFTKLLKHIYSEMYLVQKFVKQANMVGLHVNTLDPFNISFEQMLMNYATQQDFFSDAVYSFVDWLLKLSTEDEYLSDQYLTNKYDEYTVAYAQHHGIPTRFLDFTKNPLKAAFFASFQYMASNENVNEIAVYCLNKDMLDYLPHAARSICEKLEFVDNFKQSQFDYLQAQEGLFLVMTGANQYFYENGCWPDLDRYLSYIGIVSSDVSVNYKKITLPSTQVPQLVHCLDKLNLNITTMMPSYESVNNYVLNKLKLQ